MADAGVGMTCHHVWVGATPAAIEAGDDSRRCRECGARERAFVLPYIPPGSNQLFQMSYHEVAKWRKQLRADVARLVRRDLIDGKARVVIDCRWKDKRRRDPPNYVEGLKGALDALVGRWIVDDDSAHLELVVRGHTGTGESDRVVVSCEPL